MKHNPLDIISGIVSVFIGILIAFTFIMNYCFSDFSNHGDVVLWIFRILYLGIFPGFGLFFIVRGVIYFFKKDKIEENEENE